MKIRTLNAVSYNDGVTGQATGVVEGFIINAGFSDPNYETFGANYTFQTQPNENGDVKLLDQNAFTVSGTDIEALYLSVKDNVPSGLTYAETQQYLHYLAFKKEMADTFGILESEIEIVE